MRHIVRSIFKSVRHSLQRIAHFLRARRVVHRRSQSTSRATDHAARSATDASYESAYLMIITVSGDEGWW